MTSRLLLTAAASVLAVAPNAAAQKVELTPFAGLRFGGSISDITGVSYELDTAASYGLGLGFALSEETSVELLWSHQSTGFNRFAYDDDGRVDLDIDVFQIGFVYEVTADGSVQPFVGAGLGATRVATVIDESSSTHFAIGFGGGVKLLFSDHVGIRLDGRLFGTFAGSGGFTVGCGPGGCILGFGGNLLWQGEVAAGLVIAF
jgi:opacity protein-like surface antigen